MKKKLSWLTLVLLLLVVFLLYRHFHLEDRLSLDYLREQKENLQALYWENSFGVLFSFFLLYVVVSALSLPGASILTLAAGLMFGFWPSLLLVSFASSIGASLAMLLSRYLMRDWVEKKFSSQLIQVNRGLKETGALFLLSIRLIPLIPFFVINLVMGLTQMKLWTFYWVSQVGMLAGTAVYINAGVQIGKIKTLSDVMSIKIWVSFLILALFPWLAKWLLPKKYKASSQSLAGRDEV